MKQRIPYFNFYPTDFIKGVRGLTPQEVGIYTMILCRIYEENGPIERHLGRMAAYCGCTEKVIAKVIDRLVYLGRLNLIDGKISDDRADVEILKRENALKSQSRAGEISAQKRKQNQGKAATGVQRTGNHTDTDTEERKEEPIGSSKKQPRRRPEHELPPDWVPSERNITDAESRQFSAMEIQDEADRFRNHHLAKGSRFRDWDAAWRTWLGNARKYGSRGSVAFGAAPGGHGRGGSIASIVARRWAAGEN